MNRTSVISLAAVFVVLAGCGGNDTAESTDPPTPPAPAYRGSGLSLIVDTEDGVNISTIVGERSKHDILLGKAISTIRTRIVLTSNVPGIYLQEVDGDSFVVVDGTVLAGGSVVPVTVTAENLDNRQSESQNIVINILEAELVASGSLTSTGGAVSSNGGAVGVQIKPGVLSTRLGIQIRRAITPAGMSMIRLQFDRDVSAETGAFTLTSNLAWPAGPTSQSKTAAESSPRIQEHTGNSDHGDYPVNHDVAEYPGLYANGDGYFRMASSTIPFRDFLQSCDAYRASTTPLGFCLVRQPRAAAVISSKPLACFGLAPGDSIPSQCSASDVGRTFAPVLLVHGYTPGSDLGGGSGTWGDFPALINSLPGPDNKELVAFEFKWRTNVSFRVVADDLASAIIRLHELTGEPVRIVAHSFGGLLVRTLLQDQARTTKAFDPAYVHSVMTIGSPHSGIFPGITSLEIRPGIVGQFPDGQDSGLFVGSRQISCWQAGESSRDVPAFIRSLAEAGEKGGVVRDLANLEQYPLPDQLPVIVAIGLKRERGSHSVYDEGDGLITFNGQRFGPELAGTFSDAGSNWQELIDCRNPRGFGTVTEVVLGPLDANGRSIGNPAPYVSVRPPTSGGADFALGYSHSEVPVFFFLPFAPDRSVEYAEPHVDSCSSANCEEHASLSVFRHVVRPSGDNVYCIGDRQVAPPPALTMLGFVGTYVSEYPQIGTAITIQYSEIIGPGVEILGGEIQRLDDGLGIIRSSTDFGPDSIIATYVDSGTAAMATFNGIAYYFEAASPRIVNAWLDPGSSFTESEARVTFGEHAVWVNLSGVHIDMGDQIITRLELERH